MSQCLYTLGLDQLQYLEVNIPDTVQQRVREIISRDEPIVKIAAY